MLLACALSCVGWALLPAPNLTFSIIEHRAPVGPAHTPGSIRMAHAADNVPAALIFFTDDMYNANNNDVVGSMQGTLYQTRFPSTFEIQTTIRVTLGPTSLATLAGVGPNPEIEGQLTAQGPWDFNTTLQTLVVTGGWLGNYRRASGRILVWNMEDPLQYRYDFYLDESVADGVINVTKQELGVITGLLCANIGLLLGCLGYVVTKLNHREVGPEAPPKPMLAGNM